MRKQYTSLDHLINDFLCQILGVHTVVMYGSYTHNYYIYITVMTTHLQIMCNVCYVVIKLVISCVPYYQNVGSKGTLQSPILFRARIYLFYFDE